MVICEMELKNNIQTFYAKSRKDWRDWLTENQSKQKSVWLIIYHKNSTMQSINYDEAVEEALCFGWIDSKPNKRDNDSYYLFFARRNPKSNWSKANRERVDKMIKEGQMTQSGQEMVDLAKRTGSWSVLESVQNSVIPGDLQEQFDKNKSAFDNFQAFPPSSKRIILEWILNAKRPATRKQRISQTVELASKNIRANHYRQ
jgi:uncharacterized protein YdeI (YjbR/CyaY-like superfamily)